jgi:hypothetical protein
MQMTTNVPKCLVCQATNQEIPLLTLTYQDQQFHICPQHFPILIHQPQQLVGILPGAEKLTPHEHD